MKNGKTKPSQADTRKALREAREARFDHPDCLTMSIEEAARKLGLSRAQAYASAKAGELPTIRFGHRFVVPKAAFEKLFASASA